jgi:cephalosporin hydroxylase
MGRFVVLVSGHYTVVIDGVINDTYSPYRAGTWIKAQKGVETRGTSYQCVYGYWIKAKAYHP